MTIDPRKTAKDFLKAVTAVKAPNVYLTGCIARDGGHRTPPSVAKQPVDASGSMFQLSQGSRTGKDAEELCGADDSDGDEPEIIKKGKKPSPDDSRCHPGGAAETGKENQNEQC